MQTLIRRKVIIPFHTTVILSAMQDPKVMQAEFARLGYALPKSGPEPKSDTKTAA